MDQAQLVRVVDAMASVAALPLYIMDEGPFTYAAIADEIRQGVYRYGVQVVIVDYLQLLRGSGKFRAETRTLELGEITRGFKELAKELRIPIVQLSQLNREHTRRDNKVPTNADLRDSGSIEQDSNVILMLYRDEYFHPDGDKQGIAEVHITKQRAGRAPAVALLRFDGPTTTFSDLSYRAVGG
jgi:replicative DNA helicase